MGATSLIRFRLGRQEKALADVQAVDHVITDPPYSARTHKGQKHARSSAINASAISEAGISYPFFTPELVDAFVDSWAPRTRKWFCVFTSHDLVPAYEEALRRHDRYVFAPLPCVQRGSNVRLAGDGPANWTAHLLVSRPRAMRPLWGALPGEYRAAPERRKDGLRIAGSKPLLMMLDIVQDYSHEGDLVADPYAGAAVTLAACALRGRKAVGAECDGATFALGQRRIAAELAFPRATLAREAV